MRNVIAGAVRSIYTVRSVWVWLAALPVLTSVYIVLTKVFSSTATVKPDTVNQAMSLASMFTIIGIISLTVSETKRGSLPWIFSATRSRAGFAFSHVVAYVVSVAIAAAVACALAVGLASALGISTIDLGDGHAWRMLAYGFILPVYSVLVFCSVAWFSRTIVIPLGIFIALVFLIEPAVGMGARQTGNAALEFIRDILPYGNLHHLTYGADAVFVTGNAPWGNVAVLVGWVVVVFVGMWLSVTRTSVK